MDLFRLRRCQLSLLFFFCFICLLTTSFGLSNSLCKSIKSSSVNCCIDLIPSTVSRTGSSYGNIDFLCSILGSSNISKTSSKGSSFFDSKIISSFFSFSISLRWLFLIAAGFNKNNNFAVSSLLHQI